MEGEDRRPQPVTQPGDRSRGAVPHHSSHEATVGTTSDMIRAAADDLRRQFPNVNVSTVTFSCNREGVVTTAATLRYRNVDVPEGARERMEERRAIRYGRHRD